MIEKPKKPKKLNIQDKQQPRTVQEIVDRYDLDNSRIYDYLEYLVNYLNERGI